MKKPPMVGIVRQRHPSKGGSCEVYPFLRHLAADPELANDLPSRRVHEVSQAGAQEAQTGPAVLGDGSELRHRIRAHPGRRHPAGRPLRRRSGQPPGGPRPPQAVHGGRLLLAGLSDGLGAGLPADERAPAGGLSELQGYQPAGLHDDQGGGPAGQALPGLPQQRAQGCPEDPRPDESVAQAGRAPPDHRRAGARRQGRAVRTVGQGSSGHVRPGVLQLHPLPTDQRRRRPLPDPAEGIGQRDGGCVEAAGSGTSGDRSIAGSIADGSWTWMPPSGRARAP